MKKFFRDILTTQEKGFTKYSQGRVYLFISFLVFFIVNILLVYYVVTGVEIKDKDTLIIFSSNIKWALGSFALYVLGGKGIGAYRENQNSNPYQNSYSYNDDHYSYNRPYQPPPVMTRRTTVEEDVEAKNNNTPDHIKNSYYQTGDEEVD